MTTAAVIVGPGRTRPRGNGRPGAATLGAVALAASSSGADELIVVIGDESDAAGLPDVATVLVDHAKGGAAGALRVAIDWSQREGHDAIVAALPAPAGPAATPETDPRAWRQLVREARKPIAVVVTPAGRSGLVRLAVEAFALAPLEGDPLLMLSGHPELTTDVRLGPDVVATPTAQAPSEPSTSVDSADSADRAAVEELLGRPPAGAFRVVVRNDAGEPVVIENAPFLDDGTPMPTRYWLVGRRENEAVGRLEAAGGVKRAEAEVPRAAIEDAHARYAKERDSAVPAGHSGPRPTGGVGGTRVGVKCLHAHLAYYLAGGGDAVGRWVVEQLRGALRGAVAAIDCGTNSTRLLITDAAGATVERKMTITRLGEGVDRTGRLAAEAIARTVSVLASYRELMDAHAVVAQRATATSAARDAANSEEFFSAAEAVLGRRPELLSGEEEGALSYAGATAGLDLAAGPYLVVDLGGGSTELVAGAAEGGRPDAVVSLNFGCVRVTERFLTTDPPTSEEVAAARTFVARELRDAMTAHPALTVPREMVGVAGTVSTLVQLVIGLDHYDAKLLHHREITLDEVGALAGELLAEPVAVRRSRAAIEAGRADVIAAGGLIFEEVMAMLGHERARYSESDILDGIVAGLLALTS